jgi:hypothetical protein
MLVFYDIIAFVFLIETSELKEFSKEYKTGRRMPPCKIIYSAG